jgi:hypothetical protein
MVIFALNPSKLVQFMPEHTNEGRATRSSAYIQKTYPGDFPSLLRMSGNAMRKKHGAKSEAKDYITHSELSLALADT